MFVFGTISNVYITRVEKEYEIIQFLKDFCFKNNLNFCIVYGIGGFSEVNLGIFKGNGYDILNVKAIEGKVLEITSFQGLIIKIDKDKFSIHIHTTVL